MQKFYWNNGVGSPVSSGYVSQHYPDRVRDGQMIKHQNVYTGPQTSSYQTLTLAINSNNYSQQQHYIQPTSNRTTIKTNEPLCIRNNDNEFVHPNAQTFQEAVRSDFISDRVQKSEPGAKTIHLNSSSDYFIKVNGNKQCIQVNQSYLKDAAGAKSGEGSCANKVVLKLGDISSEAIHRSCNSGQSRWRYNKTWNENMKGKYRQSIQSSDIFKHDYENVYSGDGQLGQTSIGELKPERRDNSRHTPRSRKKSKHHTPGTIVRSKSCERVAGLVNHLSEKLSISVEREHPSLAPTPTPPTPTPSLLHSVAARAIPCVDIKVVI